MKFDRFQVPLNKQIENELLFKNHCGKAKQTSEPFLVVSEATRHERKKRVH